MFTRTPTKYNYIHNQFNLMNKQTKGARQKKHAVLADASAKALTPPPELLADFMEVFVLHV